VLTLKDVKILMGCVALLTVIAVGFVLQAAQSVFLPLFIAWIISYMMAPAVRFMTRLKVPIAVTTIVLLAVLLYIIAVAGGYLSTLILDSSDRIMDYYQRLVEIWGQFAARYHITADYLKGVDWAGTLRSTLIAFSGSMVTIISKSIMVVVFLMFILFGSPYVGYKMQRAFPQKYTQVLNILDSISKQIGRFLLVMVLISAATGVCIWLGLSLIGIDFAVTWGVLAFILNFIPTVGSIVASIPPVLVSLVQFYPSAHAAAFGIPPQVFMTIGVVLIVQVTIGNIITPKVMGDRMNLSPVIILLSLLLWGWLWGVAGALLSMPIAAMIKIVCDNVKQLNMVGVLMGSGQSYKREFDAKQQKENPDA
jgi:AI-2 transport protein TqsA